MFYCSVPSCPNHTKFPLYCILCNDDEPSKHDHRSKAIAIKGDSSKADWQQLRSKFSETLSKAKAWHEKHGALLDILSDEKYQGKDQLKRDFKELSKLCNDLNQFFTKEVERLLKDDNVIELQKREPQYKTYAAAFAMLEYQASITI